MLYCIRVVVNSRKNIGRLSAMSYDDLDDKAELLYMTIQVMLIHKPTTQQTSDQHLLGILFQYFSLDFDAMQQ